MRVTKFQYLRSLFPSLYFCLRYLPFKTALRLPILIYKPRFLCMKGSVRIEADEIRFGMIRLGFPATGIYPDSGFSFENNGGELVFGGKASIGSASAFAIGPQGKIQIGEDFLSNAALKIVSYYRVQIDEHVRFGWDCLVMDTDFHTMQKTAGGHTRGYGAVHIGAHCWVATRCLVQKRTELPPYTVVSGYSLVNRKYDIEERSVIGGIPAELKFTGLYRDVDNDIIVYPEAT